MKLKTIKFVEAVGEKLLGYSFSNNNDLFLRFEGEEIAKAEASFDCLLEDAGGEPNNYDLFQMGILSREELDRLEEKESLKRAEQTEAQTVRRAQGKVRTTGETMTEAAQFNLMWMFGCAVAAFCGYISGKDRGFLKGQGERLVLAKIFNERIDRLSSFYMAAHLQDQGLTKQEAENVISASVVADKEKYEEALELVYAGNEGNEESD